MAVNLTKGQKISLDKGMKMALIGLGWDTNRYTGLIVGELDRNGGQWEFTAVGRGVKNASFLDSLLKLYR